MSLPMPGESTNGQGGPAGTVQPGADDLPALLASLPPAIRASLEADPELGTLLEVVLDLGRLPEARFADREAYLSSHEVTQDDIQYVLSRVGSFTSENRAGIQRTLHRISAMRNRAGNVVGLTCRVGRAVFGSVRVVDDIVRAGKNLLLVGRPGVGKTTMLREMARVLADDVHKRVVIVDTSNEIAGDGDVPHPAIGRARRMQVATPALQHDVMIEAVQNHMPEVIIVDEMGTEQEARAARTIAERGVQLIATAHGNTLENLMVNPTLSDLVGGVQTVTLSDEEAHRRRTQKAILERKAPPTFDTLIEIQSWYRVAVHQDVARTVDRILRGNTVTPEVRWLDDSGQVRRVRQPRAPEGASLQERAEYGAPAFAAGALAVVPSSATDVPGVAPAGVVTRIYTLGVSRDPLVQAAQELGVSIQVVDSVADAEMVLTTKTHYRNGSGQLRVAEEGAKPVFVLRRNSLPQVRGFLQEIAQTAEADGPEERVDGGEAVTDAVREAQEGVARILKGGAARIQLQPQSAYVRRIQHQIAEQAQLRSRSVGRDPRRRVTLHQV